MQVKEDTIISRFQNGDRRIILWFSLFLQNVTELLDTLLLQKLYFLTPHTHVENPSSATDCDDVASWVFGRTIEIDKLLH